MTSEHMKPEALQGTGGGIPPLHYGALSRWLAAHPDVLTGWLEGVNTVDGKPGLDAVKASIGS